MSYIITEPRFSLERRVPLAVILAIVFQVAAGLIWAAQLDARVARMEKDIDRIVEKLEKIVTSHVS